MKLFYTSALALSVAATGAWAESHTGDDMSTNDDAVETDMQQADAGDDMGDMNWEMDAANLIRTRDITGGNVYTMNEADDEGWDAEGMYDAVGTDWNNIGEIEDIVLTKSGKFRGIVAEVGGFLDIGDKHVMIPVEDVSLVAVDDVNYAYVTRLSEEELESMPEVDEGFWN